MSCVYLAAPLFTDAERAWNRGVAQTLLASLPGWRVALPQDFCAAFDAGPGRRPDFARIFQACVDHLVQAQVVVAVLDGADTDSGTAWEAGFAYARGIPVIGVRTDWRPAEDGTANCMLRRGCTRVVTTVEALAEAVQLASG